MLSTKLFLRTKKIRQNFYIFTFLLFILFKALTFKCTVKPDLTTTCEQRPPVNNGQFEPSTASQNLSFIRHLCLTAAFFRSQGWPLYTGLTVLVVLCGTLPMPSLYVFFLQVSENLNQLVNL